MAQKGKVQRKVRRPLIKLLCTECKQSYYYTRKNPTNTPDRLLRKRFCKICRKRTDHKETK